MVGASLKSSFNEEPDEEKLDEKFDVMQEKLVGDLINEDEWIEIKSKTKEQKPKDQL